MSAGQTSAASSVSLRTKASRLLSSDGLHERRHLRDIHHQAHLWAVHQRDGPFGVIDGEVAHTLKVGVDLEDRRQSAKIARYGLV